MKRTIIISAVLVALSSTTAHAAPSRWALDVNTVSYHTEAWARHSLNQDNPGAGVEYQATPDLSSMAGFYRNSYRRTTAYLLAAWTPAHFALPFGMRASGGIAAGLVSGYSREEVPTEPWAAGALLRVRTAHGFGVNLLAVPNTQSGSGFVGLQVVIPIH
jgi:hypothetical protein